MKVFDCFLFYNEFDLLELRLRELYDHVDQFVIIESDHTLTNRPKPYLFEKCRARYQPWLDKITHVKHQSSVSDDPWINVTQQRNAVQQVLHLLDDNDIVVLNDADEILRPSTIHAMKTSTATLFGVRMPLFNFKFNFMRLDPGAHEPWTSAARASWVKKFGGQVLRNQLNDMTKIPYSFKALESQWTVDQHEIQMINHGGWHFSYLGDRDWIIDKIQNTVHQEDNTPEIIDQINPEASIARKKYWIQSYPYSYEIVDLDDYFPKSCELFAQHCLPNIGLKAKNFLPDHAT